MPLFLNESAAYHPMQPLMAAAQDANIQHEKPLVHANRATIANPGLQCFACKLLSQPQQSDSHSIIFFCTVHIEFLQSSQSAPTNILPPVSDSSP
jgi:hypothetical protein